MKLLLALLVALALLGWFFLRFLGYVPNLGSHMTSANFWWMALVAVAIAGGLLWNRIKTGRWLYP